MRGGRTAMLGGAAIGVIGLALVLLGIVIDRRQAYFSYLAAYCFAVSIPIGAIIFLAIGHLIGSKWFVAVRRIAEGIAMTMPVFVVLLIPILLGIRDVYPWAGAPMLEAKEPWFDPEHFAHLLHHKAPYLNTPFFIGRSIAFVLFWTLLAFVFWRWSRRQDGDPASAPLGSPRTVSAIALPLLAFTLTFAAIDWMMSLSPAWFSAAFGLYWYAGGFMAAMAVLVIAATAAQNGSLAATLQKGHFSAVGRLMFAFVVVWAYIAYAQGFIIWIGNKPEEVPWYIARVRTSWGGVGILLILGHFALPFLILLTKDIKRYPKLLSIVAGWLLLMHYVDVHWLVMPALHAGFTVHWLDLAALCAVVGLPLAFGVWRMRGQPLLPLGDPRLSVGLRYTAP
jgi:hypothetical protein